jgi:hypothetical protein
MNFLDLRMGYRKQKVRLLFLESREMDYPIGQWNLYEQPEPIHFPISR